MDLATLIKPILTAGQLRVVGSTTHEEFKHIEKDRALARRLQKITIDEPSIPETVKILEGLRSRYEAHHHVKFTDDALETAAKLAARHMRDYKLPDSAIDVLDEAGARVRLRQARKPRRAARAGSIRQVIEVGVGEIEDVVARIARIPAKQASSSDRDRLRSLEEALGRVVFGQDEAVGTVARAIKRSRAGLGQPDRPAGCFLFTRSDRRRQDRARQAAGAAPRQRVHPLRHERVHGEARGRAADRRASGIRRLRTGRPARRRDPPASLRGPAARRDREGAPRHLQRPAAGDGPRHADRQQRPQGRFPPGRADHDLERRLARAQRGHDRLLGLSGLRADGRQPAEDVAAPLEAGRREGLQPGVPQSPRRDRHASDRCRPG